MKTFEIIKQEIKKEFNKDININDNLNDLGIDSIELLDFVVKMEEKFNVEVSDEELSKIKTIKDIVDSIEKTIN